MSKVVHLSDEAHQQAKAHCRDENLKMSEWVGDLIAWATSPGSALPPTFGSPDTAQAKPRAQLPARHAPRATSKAAQEVDRQVATVAKKVSPVDEQNMRTMEEEDASSVYAAPPFWAQDNSGAP